MDISGALYHVHSVILGLIINQKADLSWLTIAQYCLFFRDRGIVIVLVGMIVAVNVGVKIKVDVGTIGVSVKARVGVFVDANDGDRVSIQAVRNKPGTMKTRIIFFIL